MGVWRAVFYGEDSAISAVYQALVKDRLATAVVRAGGHLVTSASAMRNENETIGPISNTKSSGVRSNLAISAHQR